jgi:hypothetical protein
LNRGLCIPTLKQNLNSKLLIERKDIMLYTIAVVLVVLWLVGLVTSYTMGGVIHVLLVIAVIMVLINVINGRKAL